MGKTSTLRSKVEQVSTGLPEEDGIVHRPDGLKYLSPLRAGAFLGLVRAGNLLADQLNAELEADHGISLRGFEVLLFLAVFAPDGSLGMSQLTQQTPLSQSRVSRLVDQLEARRLVQRSPAETDKREVTVSITPQGIEKFKRAQDTHLTGLEQRLFSHLTQTEIRQLANITEKILHACRSQNG
ncbi:MAG: MarR family winged helix-turn-helix transcriptional regulator [Acidimicrobiia bacterium]